MRDGTAVDLAARRAVRKPILEHKAEGLPVVIERAGRIVWISADEALDEPTSATRASHTGAEEG